MDVGVATTVWGDYGRWLPDWVASVAAQTHRPALVTIIDAGMDARHRVAAERLLRDSGLRWQTRGHRYRGMGGARNAAVRATDTQWVMHLDADDVLLPHALADAAGLAGRADVVALGAVRGDVEVVFGADCRDRVLGGQLGAFSCSPFRRSFWEARPYLTCNDWIDSALWLGYAHAGARFVPTSRPGFVYRAHPGSHSRTLTAHERLAARRQLKLLRTGWRPS